MTKPNEAEDKETSPTSKSLVTIDCRESCGNSRSCSIVKLNIELNKRLDEIKQKPVGAKHLVWLKKIATMAKDGNNCHWIMATFYLRLRNKKGKTKVEEEIYTLVIEEEMRKSILKLLDHRPTHG